jgi:hypothetical protein
METEAFPDEALDPIALDRPPGTLLGYGQAEPGVASAVCPRQYRQRLVAGSQRLIEHPPILRRPLEARPAGKTLRPADGQQEIRGRAGPCRGRDGR